MNRAVSLFMSRYLARTGVFKSTAVIALMISLACPAVADARTIRPEQVLSVVTADWNDDGSFDRAVLIESDFEPGATELLIYLSEPETDTMKLALRKLNPAWSGKMWGTLPWLALDKSNNLVIHSQNDSIGRNRWHKTVTINYINHQLVVAAFSLAEQDTLDLNYRMDCKMNFLNGKGMKNNKPLKAVKKAMLLSELNDERIYSICGEK